MFAEAWTVEQAEAIFGPELDTWEGMAALMDFSLIRTRGDGRLTMAERVRRHARELLAQGRDENELRRRHAELMAQVTEVLARDQMVDLHAVIARTRDRLTEIELALDWSSAHDALLHRRLVAAAARPFYFASRLPRVRNEIERLIATDDRGDAVSGRLLEGWALVSHLEGNVAGAATWSGAAVECHRRFGSGMDLANSMAMHAHGLTLADRGAEARVCVSEALTLPAVQANPRMRDQLEGTLAFAAVAEEEYDEAEARLAEAEWAELQAQGRRRDLEQTIDWALSLAGQPVQP